MAALDELNAHLGIIKSQLPASELKDENRELTVARCENKEINVYEQIQRTIMGIQSLLSCGKKPDNSGVEFKDLFIDEITNLESKIDATCAVIPVGHGFVTYGLCTKSAALDLARAVARRAETCLALAAEQSRYTTAALAYINRLSAFLYINARYADFEHSVTQAVVAVLDNEVKQYQLNLQTAKTIMEKIEHKAAALNIPIVVACCNAAGQFIAVHAMDNALLISYEAATSKAYTAAALKMPTASLTKLVQPGQSFYGLEALGGGKITAIGGGVPLFDKKDTLIGAIGVSGSTAETDHDLAMEGVKYFAKK